MAHKPLPLFTIPAGVPFADALAEELLRRYAHNPLALSDVLLLLPTRRACRTVQEAFLRQSAGKPLLLPRLLPVGDLDADELLLEAGLSVPQALSPRRRQLLLARLIYTHNPEWSMPHILSLAQSLAQLMDDFIIEEAHSDALEKIVPEELSQHWQITLGFLRPVLQGWRAIVAAEQALDPATRRNMLLDAQAQSWQKNPPQNPIIIAGSTGAIPAIVRLMQVVLTLPQGQVILPALPEWSACGAWWDALDAPHPLFELKQLLDKLRLTPHDVQLWGQPRDAMQPRRALLHTALLPAVKTECWIEPISPLDKMIRVDCAHEQEEASLIALLLREVLETPHKTAMLVTPDRALGRRVAMALSRWNIQVDDSAGEPLFKCAQATFLRHILATMTEAGMLPLLSLLKHPLAAVGVALPECRLRVRQIEKEVMRQKDKRFMRLDDLQQQAGTHSAWLADLQTRLQPLKTLFTLKKAPLTELLTALVQVAESLATTDDTAGAENLWRGEGGAALAEWIADLLQAGQDFIAIDPAEFAETMVTLMQGAVVRKRYGDHPRLSILGPMEARLQQADRVILAGLNEGTWPALPQPDPWLSRPMRQKIGLRAPEERIGQQAHDFYSLCCAPEVWLVRAEKQGGTPTVPARWLRRLDTLLLDALHQPALPWLYWVRQMDAAPLYQPISPPRPSPPLEARPTQLSVTQVEKLMTDPYAIYAQKILRLQKLDDIDHEPSMADWGTLVHHVLYRFIQHYLDKPFPPLDEARATLLALGHEQFASQGLSDQKSWWWPRFERLALWFIKHEQERRAKARPVAVEQKGKRTFPSGFTLTAKADRLDLLDHQHLEIIDYKTGGITSSSKDYALQLPLEAAIAAVDGFGDIGGHEVKALTYLKLSGGTPAGAEQPFAKKIDTAVSIEKALQTLEKLIADYQDPQSVYVSEPLGQGVVRYSDYRHLARVKEWASFGAEDETEDDAESELS